MNRKLLFKSLFLTFAVCLVFAINCYGEISGASSLEWLTVSSEVVATGKVLKVEKVKGQFAVLYENYTLEVSENIKGVKAKEVIKFSIRTFSTHPVFGKTINISDEVIVFLTTYQEQEAFLKGKLVPTSDSFPLSVISLNNPSRHIIDLKFEVLSEKDEIVETCRRAQSRLTEYKKQNPKAEIKGFYVEVPMDTKAFQDLFAGSSCFLRVPNFLSPNSKESILELLQSRFPKRAILNHKAPQKRRFLN